MPPGGIRETAGAYESTRRRKMKRKGVLTAIDKKN
jgi:hypothetical protein